MKSTKFLEPHLVFSGITLLQGGEWTPAFSGWLFIGISSGAAYWIHPRRNQELAAGSVLILSQEVKGTIRSSQLGQTQLHFFRIDPDLLGGLMTLGEQRFLRQVASQEQLTPRVVGAGDPIAERFRVATEHRNGNTFGQRLELLGLFVQGLGTELKSDHNQDEMPSGAKARLKELLREMPAAELMRMDFRDLVQEMCCTPRHFSRTFHEVVGTSFRDKQAEVRLTRAKELLATTQSKVLEVALESGYPSLSLFNLMFKKHTGVTPGKWREQFQNRRAGGWSAARSSNLKLSPAGI
jgi:AraC-like DNA-binding protein